MAPTASAVGPSNNDDRHATRTRVATARNAVK